MSGRVGSGLSVSGSGWAFGQYVLGYVQGIVQNAQNRPKLFSQKYIVKNNIFSIKIN